MKPGNWFEYMKIWVLIPLEFMTFKPSLFSKYILKWLEVISNKTNSTWEEVYSWIQNGLGETTAQKCIKRGMKERKWKLLMGNVSQN